MQKISLDTSANQRKMWFEDEKTTYEIIKSYVPKFYDSVYEMQEVYKAEGRIIDNIQTAFEIALNNMFIDYMDEATVSSLEDFLSIIPSESSTLDERKLVLINHFRGYGKVSADIIKETSANYNLTAETRFDEQDENSNFFLRIKLNVPTESEYTSDYINNIKILDVRLPAHLKKIYEIWFQSSSDVGMAHISVFDYTFTHTSNEADLSTMPDYYVDDEENLLTDDDGNVLIDESA